MTSLSKNDVNSNRIDFLAPQILAAAQTATAFAPPLNDAGAWLPVEALSDTDRLQLANGEIVKPGRIVKIAGRHTVYNFEVEGLHTYIAGGYRVHNDSQQAIDVSGAIGQAFGTQLGQMIAGDNTFAQLAAGTVLGAIGRNFAEEVANVGYHALVGKSFDFGSQFDDFDVDLRGAALGSISSFLTAEAGEALGLKGFGADLFNVTASAYTGSVLNQALDGGIGTISKISWGQALTALPGAVGAFFGSQLAQAILPAESLAGTIGGSLGAAGGAALGVSVSTASFGVVGVGIGGGAGAIASSIAFGFLLPGIGAFIGTLLGTFLGDLFSDDEPEEAYDQLAIDRSTGFFYCYDSDSDGGGNRKIAHSLRNAFVPQMNSYVAVVGGIGFMGDKTGPNPLLAIGYDQDEDDGPFIAGFGSSPKHDWAAKTPEGIVDEATVNSARGLQIAGGDIFLKRAVANSQARDSFTLAGDMQIAVDYAKYISDRDTINALIQASPDSALTAGWMITLARAQELQLSVANKTDFNGGVVGFLASLNLDSLGVSASDVYIRRLDGAFLLTLTLPADAEVPAVFEEYADSFSVSRTADSCVISLSWLNQGSALGFVATTAGGSPISTQTGNNGVSEFFIGSSDTPNRLTTADSASDEAYQYLAFGSDIILGRSLADHLEGGSGWDWISGGDGDDELLGKGGVDILTGGDGNDSLNGGYGSDTLIGGLGADILVGGDAQIAPQGVTQIVDIDIADYGDSEVAIVVNLATGAGQGGTAAGDTLTGVEGVIGSKFDDTLTGSAGDDVLEGGKGADILNGGAGVDVVSYQHSSDAVNIDLSAGTATGGDAAGDSITGAEGVIGSQFDDVITGDSAANHLSGGEGDDLINGGAEDTLDGGSGDDILIAGQDTVIIERIGGGYDEVRTKNTLILGKYTEVEKIIALSSAGIRIYGGDIGNEIIGNSGEDILKGWGGSDVIEGGGGADTLDGGEKTNKSDMDVVRYTQSAAAVTINLDVTTAQTGGDAEGDTLAGFEGVIGSKFNDSLRGDAEDNYFDGGDGADAINGAEGEDVADYTNSDEAVVVNLATQSGAGGYAEGDALVAIERLVGSNFNDQLTGDASANVLGGGSGDDFLIGGAGNDTLDGGDGADTVSYENSTKLVTVLLTGDGSAVIGTPATGVVLEKDALINIENVKGSAYADVITGSGSANVLDGGAGQDTLAGLLGNDTLKGGAGDDNLDGGDGDDILEGGSGADTLKGGAGRDTLSYAGASAAVRASLVVSATRTGDATGDILNVGAVDIENLTGSAFADTLYGDQANNVLAGLAGADQIVGGAGEDQLDYTASLTAVTVNLNTGLALGGDAQGDVFSEMEGVIGSSLDDAFVAAVGTNVFNGGNGLDTVDYSILNSGITVSLVTGEVTSGGVAAVKLTSIEKIIGTAFADTITGGARSETFVGGGGIDVINGGGGYDVISGGAGNDTLDGGAGDDTVEGGSGADTLKGGDGLDTLSYAAATAGVTASLISSIQSSSSAGEAAGDTINVDIENITGSAFSDRLYGNGNDNVLTGGAGADTITGGGGGGDHDVLDYSASSAGVTVNLATGVGSGGDAQGDTFSDIEGVMGSAFADTLTGSDLADVLNGGAGNDVIRGGVGSDTLNGGDGDDTLYGDENGDRLDGGAGNDTLYGGVASDVITGGDGDDVIEGGGSADTISGGAGIDTVSYRSATSGVTASLISSVQADNATGEAIGDTINADIENITGSAFNDRLYGNGNDNVLTGGAGADILLGGGGSADHDVADYSASSAGVTVNLTTGAGSGGDAQGDSLSAIEGVTGSAFTDVFVGTTGANAFDGGAGFDLVDYSSSSAAVRLSLLSGEGGTLGDALGDTFIRIENATGSDFNDIITGGVGTNTLRGGAGNDTLNGDAGNDTLYGGLGADTLNGGDGDDKLYGEDNGDTLNGGAGNDELVGGLASDVINGGDGDDLIDGGGSADTISGGAGVDTVTYRASTAGVTASLISSVTMTGEAAGDTINVDIENITGSAFNDRLYGNGNDNVLTGGAGADYLSGGGGSNDHDVADYSASYAGVTVNLATGVASGGDAQGDTFAAIEGVTGSAFTDVFVGTTGANAFDGGAGFDLVDYSSSSAAVRLSLLSGEGGTLGDALGDTFIRIENATGTDFNDIITGGVGTNTLRGGAGNDTLNGDAGNDTLYGGLGADTLNGGDGDDKLYGEDNGDTLNGGAGNDELVGGLASDVINGGDGDDLIDGGGSADTVSGGDGLDTLSYAAATAGVTASLISSIQSSSSAGEAAGDTINVDIENITGSAFSDRLYGNGNDNVLTGGAGADTITGGGGGGDHDVLDYSASSAGVTVNLATGVGSGGDAQGDTFSDIEGVMGSAFADTLTGSDLADVLNGGAGNDVIRGGVGSDTLNGGDGDDTLYGDENGDRLDGGAGNDTLYGGVASDVITGGDGDDVIEGGGSADTISGGAGIDTVSYRSATSGVTASLISSVQADNATGEAIGDTINADIENITGSAFNDRLYGNGNDNVLTGGAGADILLGGGGSADHDVADYSASSAGVTVNLTTGAGSGGDAQGDSLSAIEGVTGSAFTDVFVGTTGANAFDGGAGFDLVDYSSSSAAVRLSLLSGEGGTLGDALGDTFIRIENATGSDFNDIITGGVGTNTLRGGAGNDTLNGDAGNDTLYGGLGADTLNGGDGDDKLYGEDNGDTLNGGAGNDELVGGLASDVINGGDGDDLIDGGGSADTISGGAGVDTVTYRASTAGVTASLISSVTMTGEAAGDTINVDIENITGSAFNDRLYGNGNDNVLTGGAGADYLSGGGGSNDHDVADYSASYAGVTVNLATGVASGGDAQGDTFAAIEGVTGSAFADTLTGSDLADALNGGAGADVINAGVGNDIVTGGAGDDTLSGGSGADSFVFAQGFGKDVISDFVTSGVTEKIVFADGLFDDFADLLASTTQVGSDTVITFDANHTLKLAGIAKSALLADDFSFTS